MIPPLRLHPPSWCGPSKKTAGQRRAPSLPASGGCRRQSALGSRLSSTRGRVLGGVVEVGRSDTKRGVAGGPPRTKARRRTPRVGRGPRIPSESRTRRLSPPPCRRLAPCPEPRAPACLANPASACCAPPPNGRNLFARPPPPQVSGRDAARCGTVDPRPPPPRESTRRALDIFTTVSWILEAFQPPPFG